MPVFVPPYPEALTAGYSGYPVSVNDSVPGYVQVPDQYNLTWMAGDTAFFQFFFPGECWTEVDPFDPEAPPRTDGITWVMTVWESQVRGSRPVYWGYWWPPIMPYGVILINFVVTAEFVEAYAGTPEAPISPPVPGTTVTLEGGTIWPGSFKWDLQSKHYPDPVDLDHYAVRTRKSGDVEVLPQVTQHDAFPPSHWPVYPGW